MFRIRQFDPSIRRFLFLVLLAASPADGQDIRPYQGPPPPPLPETMARDTAGRTTLRAVRLAAPLRIDGQLDEELYRTVVPASDFIQLEPAPGAPATEKTEVWVAFDADNVYVSVRAWESQPERMVVNDMRRDGASVWQNENFAFALDTFYDRRNSVNFQFNPIGGRMDGQNTNEGQYNGDWNPVWDFAVRRVEGGWTGEAAVPFKSLRYRAGQSQLWGIQLRRINRWKNELSYLTRVPDGLGTNGILRTSAGATLVGIEAPPGSRALDVKPYVTSDLSSDRAARPRIDNKVGKDFGVDAKYGVTQGLTADLTYNTDFAQVEADEQQVNLTRFSLFFPEKRDFFLENQGLFAFGGVTNSNFDVPVLFYSRRIGLDQGQAVPVDAGGRLSGRAGRFTLGLLNMQTDDVEERGIPSSNFTVARLRRDILRRSAIGVMATRRSNISGGTQPGGSYGVDGSFAFFTNFNINAFWARSNTATVRGHNSTYRLNTGYNGDRWGLMFERMMIGDQFNPEIGFIRRDNFDKSRVALRFSPRPARITRVRKFSYEVQPIYYWNLATGRLETREIDFEFYADFQNSDRIDLTYQHNYELLTTPFAVSRGVTIPEGGYGIRPLRAQFTLGAQRAVSGALFVETGRFYQGTRTQFGYSSARIKLNPHLAVEPGISINRVTLPFGDFTTRLVSSRVTHTITPMLFLSALVQFNSSNNTLSTNARLRWEYHPGSELFVVYNEGRDTLSPRMPELQQRSFVIKVNRLLRF
jgi:hypothetical protein